MNRSEVLSWLGDKAGMSFSRSSGPGGQNVNKVSTKATITVALRDLEGITEDERLLLLDRLGPRLSDGAVLIVQVQDTRSQARNRELAVQRALEIIERGLHRDRPRRPTRPGRAAKERRLQSKKALARIKRLRGGPSIED
jgi:ribosome-associated protein